jgi:hypothetical protein
MTEVFGFMTILVSSNIHVQNELDEQDIDTLKICSVKSIYILLGPLIIADEKSEILFRKSISSKIFLS